MMMGGSLVNEEIRESLFWSHSTLHTHPGAGRGRVSSLLSPPAPSCCSAPAARCGRPALTARAPCLRRPGSESVACLRLRVSLVHVVQESTHYTHITVSITGHEYRQHHHSPFSHIITSSPDPQWWIVCYEQVKAKAEHISQSPCDWVPGNQGSDHTRTKTKVARLTFTQSADKHQTRSECWCPAPWPLPCPPWCPQGCPAWWPPPPPPSCPPSPPPYRSVAGVIAAVREARDAAQVCSSQLSSAQHPARAGGSHVPASPHITQAALSCTGFLISGKCFK